MDQTLLRAEVQKFITDNVLADTSKLALQKNPFADVEWRKILNEIACKAKARHRLPLFFESSDIIYPSKIQLEQTSSEKTARYKADLVSGKSLIDLTGGFGVDAAFFSKKVKDVIHCEINQDLSETAKHNFKILKINNIESICGDGFDILKSKNQKFDWIYIDPSRRNEAKGKVFILKDCLPNVPQLLSEYLKYANCLLIKTAPILDISAGLQELKNVKAIHIVAVENEVKELLWIIEKDYIADIKIVTINIAASKTDLFSFNYSSCISKPIFENPLLFLYEPNAAIMKSGGFDEVAKQYKIGKLHQNTQLYTSSQMIEFPGRIFEIIHCFDYSKANMILHLKDKKANITTRNFSETVIEIRKKWKISDGGAIFCFFTTNKDDKKIVLLCKKINN